MSNKNVPLLLTVDIEDSFTQISSPPEKRRVVPLTVDKQPKGLLQIALMQILNFKYDGYSDIHFI